MLWNIRVRLPCGPAVYSLVVGRARVGENGSRLLKGRSRGGARADVGRSGREKALIPFTGVFGCGRLAFTAVDFTTLRRRRRKRSEATRRFFVRRNVYWHSRTDVRQTFSICVCLYNVATTRGMLKNSKRGDKKVILKYVHQLKIKMNKYRTRISISFIIVELSCS